MRPTRAAPPWGTLVVGPAEGVADAVPDAGPGAARARRRARALTLLAVRLGRDPGALRLTHVCPVHGPGDHGAPVLEPAIVPAPGRSAGGRLPAIGLTHSRHHTVLAWLDAGAAARGWRIGVDVEDLTDPVAAAAFHDDAALARPDGVAFTAAEARRIARLPAADRPRARAELWCLREATVKAAGTGFTGDPRQVATAPGDRRWLGADAVPELPAGLVAAVVIRPPGRKGR